MRLRTILAASWLHRSPRSASVGASLLVSALILMNAAAASAGESGPSESPTQSSIVDFEQYRGKVLLLDFWASWCVPCRRSFPWMDSMARKYADRGLVVVAVSVDERREAADAFLQGTDYQIEIVYDPEGELSEAWDLEAMPSSILFDREGSAAFRHSGFVPANTDVYEEHLVSLLEGREQATPELSPRAARTRGGVRPWEKGLLALESMALNSATIDLAWDDHIYFSKEASSGGRSFGGGGCGCN